MFDIFREYAIVQYMKHYALLRLYAGANSVLAPCGPCSFKDALEEFRKIIALDDYGYAQAGDVTYCIAEFYESFTVRP